MASKKAKNFQATWMDKISRAKKVRKNWKDLFRVDLARQFLDGKQAPSGSNAEEYIVVNKFYSHHKSQLPSLYSLDPYFYVRLRRSFSPNPMDIAMWELRGKVRQANLNYLKVALKLKQKVRLSIQDAQTSYGVIKTHFSVEDKENPDFGGSIMGDDGVELLDEDTGEPLMEPETIPINEKYHITHVHPDDFVWDEDAGPLEDDWHWLGHRTRMTLEEARKNPKYKKSALNKLKDKSEFKDDEDKERETRKKGNDIAGRSERESSAAKPEKPKEILSFWEIYDLDNEEWFVIAEDADIAVVEPEPVPKGIDKHPFSILMFTPRDDSAYPLPPMSQGIDLQREYNNLRSKMQTHRKRFNRKYTAFSGAFENAADEVSKLVNGEDGTVLLTRSPEQAIFPINDAPLDQMTYQELGYLDREMVEIFGGSYDESRGLATADSATQAALLDKRLEMKEGDSMSMVVDFVKEIARKLDLLVQTNITKDEAVKVAGPQGEAWTMIRAKDYEEIDGEYEYTVNVGSTIPKMPQTERASWIAFMTFLGNNPQFLMSPQLLKQASEMHHIEDEILLKQLADIGKKMMSGAYPMTGNSGSQAGVGEDRPVSAMGGIQGGGKSMDQPGGGNIDG